MKAMSSLLVVSQQSFFSDLEKDTKELSCKLNEVGFQSLACDSEMLSR